MMQTSRSLTYMALAACTALATGLVHAEIFKCAGAKGRPVYQDSPCDGSVKRSIAPQPEPPKIDAGWAASVPEDERRFVGLLESYQKCTHALPAIGYNIAMDYQRWRSEHSAMLARLERDPAFQAAMREAAGEGDRSRGKLTEQQRQATAAGCASLEYAFAPPQRTLSEVKAEMDRAAPAACEDLKREYRLAHTDRASLEYPGLQREADERARQGPGEAAERLERKLQSLPAPEQEQARSYREGLRAQCAKREGLADYKPAAGR